MNIKHTRVLIVCVAVIACVFVYYAFVDQKQIDNDIRIGGAFGLSGNCAEWGEGEKMAAQMAVDEINASGGVLGKQVRMIIEDTQCENKTTVNAVMKLIHADNVVAIIGPTWGDAYQGASAVFNQTKTVGISPDTAMEALELENQPIDYIFSTYAPQRKEIDALQTHAARMGIKTVASVWDQDSYSTMMTRLFKDAAVNHGMQVVEEHEMPTGNQDFRTTIAKIKNKNPDAIFISFLAAHTKASFLKQAKDLGLQSRILSAADIQDESVLKSFGALMDGVIYTYPIATSGQKTFKEAYYAKYTTEPQGPSAVNAYDAVRILVAALASGAEGGEDLRNTLLRTRIKGAFIEDLGFNEKHQVGGGTFEVKTIRDGAFVSLQ